MTWVQDEQSIQTSAPIELYTFQTPSQAWYLTSYRSDVVVAPITYTAVPLQRSNTVSLSASDADGSFTIDMPATHALPQFYANGIPPRELTVVVSRLQKSSGFAMTIGLGYITALSFKRGPNGEGIASFKVGSPADVFTIEIPTITAGRLCPHILYDTLCTMPRAGFTQATTIVSISADMKTTTVASMGNFAAGGLPTPDQWALSGEIVHQGTSERRVIGSQIGNVITQSYRWPPQVGVGDVVLVSAGCKHTTDDCFNKFSNILNFGGFPQLPLTNPFYVSIKYIGS